MTITPPEPQSLEELLASGPTGAAAAGERTLIGVPAGYVVTRPGQEVRVEGIGWRPGQPTTIVPVFYDGDEYGPAQWSAEERATLQLRMFHLGILNRDFHAGVWDAASRQAFRSVLEFANGAGITEWEAALAEYGAQVDVSQARGGGGPKRAPLVVRQTSPEELRRVFAEAASQVLGERASDAEVDRMIRAYHAKEASFQRQAWDATYEGGTVTEPPSAATFAESELERTRPLDTAAYDVADRFAATLTNELAGPFGG